MRDGQDDERMSSDLVIGMAGSGGDGVVSAGESLTSAAACEGYHVIMTKSFGSQIRGGESSCRVRLSPHPIFNPGGTLDVAVALNWDDFLKFGAELPVGGQTVVIYDAQTGVAPSDMPLVGVSPSEVFACRSPRWRSAPPAASAPRTSSCSACSPAGSASRRTRCCAASASASRRRAPAVLERRGAGLRRRARVRRRASAAPALRRDRARRRRRGGEAADRRQRDVRRRRDLRRLRVLRRLSDHALHRDHAVPQPRDLEVRRRGAAGGGRDRRHRRRAGRVVRRARRR